MMERHEDQKRKRIADIWKIFKPTFSAQSAFIYETLLWISAELLVGVDQLVSLWKSDGAMSWIALCWMTLALLVLLINTLRFRKLTYERFFYMLSIIISYAFLF